VTKVSLEFIAQQLERLQSELRIVRNQLAGVHDQLTTLPSIRDELTLQREQLRMHGSAIARLNDTVTMDILDRLRTLETGGAR
jgi:chromosome segregation ATPase